MSELALLAAWGSPESINRTVGVWGEHRQYVYPTGRAYHNKYVYTQDGIVTSYQD
ncbi:MAG: hypothetical protein IMY86_13860 [Chloroflexi bacterium]|nr:hypothetical protein [Chloroflexota bacterium]